jgi:signal transduction histidine kinase
VVLIACLLVTPLAMAADMLLNSASSESIVRSVVYLSIGAFSVSQLRRQTKVYLLPMYLALVFAGLSLSDSIRGTELSLTDPESTLTVLVLVAITYIAIAEHASMAPLFVFSLGTAVFAVATGLSAEFSTTNAIGFLLVGTVGQGVVLWIVSGLFRSLAHATTIESKHALVQKALAECSQALLTRGSEDPLDTALDALLDSTEAFYAYIDVNRIDQDGNIRWEIVAEAQRREYPEDDLSYVSGDYQQLDGVLARLQAGEPAEVITSKLPMPLRAKYEAEGIKAELIAPILIGNRWMGSLGYTDHIREGTWSEIEIEGLMRAAEMVAAYWEREAAREGLMELAKAKDRFIAAVSHELRTPLSAVVGFAGAMANGVESYSAEELTEMSSVIYAQSIELTHLVDDLLTSERAASGNLTIQTSDIALLDLCRDIVESTGLDVEVSVEGAQVISHADPLRTRQILRNLLTNAARYGGDEVVVEVSESDGFGIVSVRDNGRGVSHIDVEQIFEPYYRTQGEGSAPDSVGLGLAVARQLAVLMGGNLIYRRSNSWTAFELSLPLAAETALVN